MPHDTRKLNISMDIQYVCQLFVCGSNNRKYCLDIVSLGMSPETAAVVHGSLVQMVAWIGGDVLGPSPR